jgi:hypothetical protein
MIFTSSGTPKANDVVESFFTPKETVERCSAAFRRVPPCSAALQTEHII